MPANGTDPSGLWRGTGTVNVLPFGGLFGIGGQVSFGTGGFGLAVGPAAGGTVGAVPIQGSITVDPYGVKPPRNSFLVALQGVGVDNKPLAISATYNVAMAL